MLRGRFFLFAMLSALVSCGETPPIESSSGGVAELCENDFKDCVMPVLSGQIRRSDNTPVSCMDAGCHLQTDPGSGLPPPNGGSFTLHPTDMAANFEAVKRQIRIGSSTAIDSRLLVEPTQDNVLPVAGAGSHGGGEIFPNTTNACSVAIQRWISISADPPGNCGVCATATPVANTMFCGY